VPLETGRLIALPGTCNLRDLGGYPTLDGRRTAWRTVYRSECLDQLDEAGQAWLVEAGLRTIVDLREDDEVASRPNVFADSERIIYRRLPFWDRPMPADLDPDLSGGYRRELDLCGEQVCAVFEALLAAEALPALIHCAAGKDRTGVVVGLLLEVAGVSREAISQDYAMSAECLGPENVAQGRIWIAEQGWDWARWAHTFETPPERMHKTLDYLDEQFGGIEPYLLRHGLDADQLERLRHLLIANK
jgi:protein-tyrosine phosphatase